jgi:linoleate 8R-lipoxygenase/9,12-octadecadienoate 8-hydroperoxide 8R-isomerase
METLVIPETEAIAHAPFDHIISSLHKQHNTLSIYGTHMIQQLFKSGLGSKDIVWSQILPTAGGMVANQGQLFAQCLDFYLSDEAAPHLKEIQRLAKLDTQEADDLLLRYFMEGTRIRATVGLYRRSVTDTTTRCDETITDVKKGETVLCDLVAASQDPAAFPDPDQVKLDRPLDSYIHFGWGRHMCLGIGITKIALTTMLKTVGKLHNLRRAPGGQGQIKKIAGPGGITMYMTADQSSYFPFPTSMKIRWDGDLDVGKTAR